MRNYKTLVIYKQRTTRVCIFRCAAINYIWHQLKQKEAGALTYFFSIFLLSAFQIHIILRSEPLSKSIIICYLLRLCQSNKKTIIEFWSTLLKETLQQVTSFKLETGIEMRPWSLISCNKQNVCSKSSNEETKRTVPVSSKRPNNSR